MQWSSANGDMQLTTWRSVWGVGTIGRSRTGWPGRPSGPPPSRKRCVGRGRRKWRAAIDRNGAEYGIEPIEKAVAEAAEEGAQAVIDRISGDLRDFLGDIPQNDDITLIALQKR